MRSLTVRTFPSSRQHVLGIGSDKKLLMERFVLASSCTRAAGLHTNTSRVLITGALGQLGFGLARILRDQLGNHNVVMSDIHKASKCVRDSGPYVYLNVQDQGLLTRTCVEQDISCIVHYSAILSADAEANTQRALDINIIGLHNVLEVSRQLNLKLFVPSTIGSFGPESPRNPTPDLAVQRPKTVYGICKVHAELMGEYYHTRFGLDFRCLRYPGVISEHKPGGGTTDYALKMFHDSVNNKVNVCFLKPDTRLPMIYIDDLHHATVQYMQIPNNLLKKRTYNIGALDFTPEELALEIQKENPHFQVTYKPDYRQHIAETWPEKLDYSNAMSDWGYRPNYTLETACQKILRSLKIKLNEP